MAYSTDFFQYRNTRAADEICLYIRRTRGIFAGVKYSEWRELGIRFQRWMQSCWRGTKSLSFFLRLHPVGNSVATYGGGVNAGQ